MSTAIGFVILVNPFNRLGQTARLIHKLNAMFDSPPIAVHHDFGKNPNFIANCPSNVRLVQPHVDTKWGDFTCIEAAVRAIRLLYAGPQTPDWFVYLSGSDYPIKPAAKILADLQSSTFDAHIQHLPLVYKKYPTWWQKICFKRTCSVRVTVPWITKKLKLTTRNYWISNPLFTMGRLPYSDHLKPFAGEAWFCANHRAAQTILDFYDTDRALAEHCRQILVPEETYFHTVLANAPGLKLSQNYFRYVDWAAPGTSEEPLNFSEVPNDEANIGSNPKTLTMEDLPKISKSSAHFARKFGDQPDSLILNTLDELTA
jgi:hypothetical protein